MRPYTKQKLFYPPSLGQNKSANSSLAADLPIQYLNKISVFETLRSYQGKLFRPERHIQRLSESCISAGHALPFEVPELIDWLKDALKESAMSDSMLRLSLHWEALEQGIAALIIRPFTEYPREWYEKGVSMVSTVYLRPSPKAQDPQIKCSQYVSGVLATIDQSGLVTEKPHELLFGSAQGTISEGTVSNIFILKQKTLLTPSAASGILKGVTRAFVLELAKKRHLEVVETQLTRHELYSADECFMTNTSSEVLPVVRLDGRVIGDGKPGPITCALAQDFKEHR